MKIGVIGGGAIGFLTASKLNSVHDITLYVRREEQKSLLVQEGLHEKNVCEHHVQVKLIREIGKKTAISFV
ncbi:2-dehydropantoate 2-reductase N-terminal domain-containing protein [Paracerasibacillus soli]|uniref:2-dehydropantoate 2-reductase N-terminal domain-containing protein n=1 Tax=Paracerasibacillus soli TaxID=480284 RepID=A0ABU5CP11_9BACI|nr:2-dehydropantoate 2-reductase N-terminal domain-containing protein [Virgibacillus soli]MDY0408096.1 2-dehydropantoate 2-reductase N-terminal domain-containing protein [Virgibacillus soli]